MRSKRWLQNLALSAVTTLLCVLVVELALRLISPVQTFVNPLSSFHRFDPELGWTGTPNLKAKFRKIDFDVMVRSDAEGFRARESTVQPRPASPVIAVLGDSFTWGWGVGNGKVFTDVMQDELGTAAEIRNFGVNAYGTLQELLLLKRYLSNGLRPQYVVVMFYQNDFYDNVGAEDRKPWLSVVGTNVTIRNHPVAGRAVSPLKKVVKASYLLSAIGYAIDFAKEKRRVTELEQATFTDNSVADEPRAAMAFCLEQFREACERTGIKLWFVYVPSFTDVQSQTTSQVRVAIKSLCDQKGVALLDLTGDFRAAAGNRPLTYYFPHDSHWNEAGHDLVGKLLVVALKQEMSAAGQYKE